MRPIWFKKRKFLYKPAHWVSWLLSTTLVLYCVWIFITIDVRSHSASDTLYGVAPYFLAAFFFWWAIAVLTSDK